MEKDFAEPIVTGNFSETLLTFIIMQRNTNPRLFLNNFQGVFGKDFDLTLVNL